MVVSHAIAALEARHETKLFDRIGRRIALTQAGRVFLMEARAIQARAGAAELALSEFGTLKRGTLCVQASQTIAGYWLPRHLVAFQRADPRLWNSAPHPSAGGTLTVLFVRCPAHTTNLSATPGRPACHSRASGWFRGPRLGASHIS
jgi:DNA-binding transcriptional LysR family regulator